MSPSTPAPTDGVELGWVVTYGGGCKESLAETRPGQYGPRCPQPASVRESKPKTQKKSL